MTAEKNMFDEKKGWRARNAQVSNEFVFLLGATLIMLTAALYFVSDEISDAAREREYDAIRDLGFSIQNEFILAESVNDGYVRHFDVPDRHYGFDYDIWLYGNMLLINSTWINAMQEFYVPKVNGTIKKGVNVINKTGGVIYLN